MKETALEQSEGTVFEVRWKKEGVLSADMLISLVMTVGVFCTGSSICLQLQSLGNNSGLFCMI